MYYRPSEQRGIADFGWLKSRHSFSFGNYYDPTHMGFGPLRVINEDRVAAGQGFPTHGHANMEIISYVINGALEHRDSTGHGSVIRPGDIQRMSAGSGIRHSEFNASQTEPVHFLQIWLQPAVNGLAPSYEEKAFTSAERTGGWTLLGSQDARAGSVLIQQDVSLYSAIIESGMRISYDLSAQRKTWLQVVHGSVRINGREYVAGDGLGWQQDASILLDSESTAEVLLFDMTPGEQA